MVIPEIFAEPVLKDGDFVVQKFVSGFCCGPTTIAFEGNDILVLERFHGKVYLVRDGMLQEKLALDENVNSTGEQGMLGITAAGTKIYLYFTESEYDGGPPLAKRVYSYDWTGQELVNKTLVKDLPQTRTYHNGGAMITDLNGSVYLIVGDMGRYGKLQNHPKGEPDDTSVIMRIDQEEPYYAMGIRNSFGLAIDPVTGNIWDTENGDDDFDEVNFVQPNFNSGWEVIMGPANENELAILPGYDGYVYSDPEFSWQQVVAPTAISFVDSKPLEKFKNNVFAGDCLYGNLYKFELNSDRTGFVFDDVALSDNVVNTGESMDEVIFGTGFGCLTDIEVGPDGLLYILSLSEGTIYKIIPATMVQKITEIENTQNAFQTSTVKPTAFQIEDAVYAVIAALIIAGIVFYLTKVKRKSK